MVSETVTRNYFFIFFSALEFQVFFLQSLIFTDGFMRPSNSEMKQETDVIAIVMYLSYVALKWCMTSPSYIHRLFVPSPLFSGLDFN